MLQQGNFLTRLPVDPDYLIIFYLVLGHLVFIWFRRFIMRRSYSFPVRNPIFWAICYFAFAWLFPITFLIWILTKPSEEQKKK